MDFSPELGTVPELKRQNNGERENIHGQTQFTNTQYGKLNRTTRTPIQCGG